MSNKDNPLRGKQFEIKCNEYFNKLAYGNFNLFLYFIVSGKLIAFSKEKLSLSV